VDRIILAKVLERNEPEFGHITRRDLHLKSFEPGVGHIATAIWLARDAIASGDETQIAMAAKLCPTYERTGHKLIERSLRRRGGALQGARQSAQAAPFGSHTLKNSIDSLMPGCCREGRGRLSKR
jgi:hypothetical protein